MPWRSMSTWLMRLSPPIVPFKSITAVCGPRAAAAENAACSDSCVPLSRNPAMKAINTSRPTKRQMLRHNRARFCSR